MSTSRTEIADHVAPTFGKGSATKDELLATAHSNGAPSAVLDELQRLPEQSYRDLRELWPELPGLPVEP
jgi:hypothetical protein